MKHSSGIVLAFLSAAVCSAAMAGNVCNWTGGAADGKWSSPSNWDTPPASGNGDELVFDTSSGAIETENCVEDFDIAKITVTGSKDNALTINGSRILFKSGPDGATESAMVTVLVYSVVPVVLKASVAIDKTYCLIDHTGAWNGGSVTVNGDVYYGGSGTLRLRSERSGGNAVAMFNGAVSAPNGFIQLFPTYGGRLPVFVFNGKVAAKAFGLSNYTGNWGAEVTVENKTTTPSAIETLHSGYGFLHLKSENVFAENGVLNLYHCEYGSTNGTTLYADQKVKRLACSNRNRILGKQKSETCVKGSGYPTLTIADDADEDISSYFDDQLNLAWSPVGANTLSITNAMTGFYSNTISGTITVAAGSVKACAGTTFKHLSKLVVLNAARFEVAENNANPLGDCTVALLDADARLVLKSDCTLANVIAAGQVVAAGTYTASQLPSVIAEGSTGSLTVLSSSYTEPGRACWIGQGGEYSVAANWMGEQLPSASLPGFIGCFPGAQAAKITETTTIDGALTVDGFAGGAQAVLTTSTDVSFVEKGLTLGANGKLSVTAGTVTTKALTTKAGGEIALSGTGALTSERVSGSLTALGFQDATIRMTGESSFTSAQVAQFGETYLRDLFGASAGNTLSLEASGSAVYCSHALTFALGLKPSGAAAGGTSRFSFAGQSSGSVGHYAYVGYADNGNGELCIADQALFSNDANSSNYGLFLGYAATSQDAPATGVLRVSGGRLLVQNNQNNQALSGLNIGLGINSDSGNTNCNVGVVYLSGGAITNSGYAAWTVIGAGAAKGAVYQTGGVFAAVPDATPLVNNTVIGFRGGNGRYEISGGRYYGTQNVIVGGMAKNDGPLPAQYTVLETDRKGTGVLKVTGGTFETAKDVLVSHGGDGTVEIGAAGTLKAANLRLESETARLAFAPGSDTSGKIVLSGALEIAEGAAIEVEVSNLVDEAKVTLVEAADMSGFNLGCVVLNGYKTDNVRVRKTANQLFVVRSVGMTIYVR